MPVSASNFDVTRLSRLIERTYECALDPSHWPATLQAIGLEYGFIASTMLMVDFRTDEQFHLAAWNCELHYLKLIREKFAASSAAMFRQALALVPEPDEPLTLSRGPFDLAAFQRSPMYTEWARPQGFGDAANVVVLNEPARLGSIAFVRAERDGPVTDAQLLVLRLLAPHLRRAVAIADIMSVGAMRAQVLSGALDLLAAGVVVVDARGGVIEANAAARQMGRKGWPIVLSNGRLTATYDKANAELQDAIAWATRRRYDAGGPQFEIGLNAAADPPALAHILPVGDTASRSPFAAGGCAAVFVTTAQMDRAVPVASIAASFGLTPAESALFGQLASGRSLGDSAEALNIALTTAKTHLAHIFAKTGVSRQSELIRLALTLAPKLASRN